MISRSHLLSLPAVPGGLWVLYLSGGMTIDRDGRSSEDPQVINWAAWKSSIGFTLGWW